MQKKLHPLSVAILYYAGTHEDDQDTITGVKGIAESLKRTGHKVRKIVVTKRNWRRAVQTPGDIVFNFVEDDTWELYELVANDLEALGRAQVGHDCKGLQYSMKKSLMKKRLHRNNISTPNFEIYTNTYINHISKLSFPVIVKPSTQHAGIGISQESVVTDVATLRRQVNTMLRQFSGEVIAEEFVSGREIHVTIIGNGRNVRVLPYCEIWFGGTFKEHWTVYTYEAKWSKKSWEYADARVAVPAKISRRLTERIRKLAVRAYHTLECRDIARLDFRIDEKETPFLVDVNMNPSINYYDDQDATLASVYALRWTYDEFIEKLLSLTHTRVSAR